MKGKGTNRRWITERLVWIGIGLAVFWWFIDANIHAFVLNDGNFTQSLFRPPGHELWMHSITAFLLILFSIYAQFIISQRRRAEEETMLALEELNQIFDTAADGMRVVDRDFNVLRVNETFVILSGVSKDEAIGKKCYEVFRGPLCHTPKCPLSRILGGEERVEYELEKERNDGSTAPCIITATPFRAPSGELIGIVEDFKDNADRKQKEAELIRARDEWERTFNAVPDLIMMIDDEHRILCANKAMADKLGYTPEGLVGLTCYEVVHGTEKPPDFCPHTRLLADGLEHSVEVFEQRLGGHFAVSVSPLRGPDGMLTGSVHVARDITDRKQAEEALRQSEQRFRSLVETTSDWVWEVDHNGIYTYASPKVKDLLGYEPVEVIGKTPYDFMPMDEAKRVARLFGDIIESRKVFAQFENTNFHKDGRRVVLETSGVPIFDQAGELLCYRGVDRDITGRKRAEEEKERLEAQLRQAHKMEAIGTLAGGIAHDFNNILTPMIIHTEIAMSNIAEESPVRDNLQRVSQAAHRAKDVVRQILTFSRQASTKPFPTKIAPVVREVLKLLRASMPTTIEIRQNIKSTSYLTVADPTQIHQVLINLCTNAEHAMREKGGVLDVSLTDMELGAVDAVKYPDMKPGPYLRFTVSDTGTGMDRTVIERIFDPFFTTKQRGEGTGMGLAVVHGIVKSCGGAITVDSEPEKGATFHVFFPRTETEASQQILPAGPLPTGNERILFVDDAEFVIDAVRPLLESLGYKVVARMNGIEAMEVFRPQPEKFDLVITDQTMPHMSGKVLAQELIRIRPSIPIILCTGYSELITEEEAKTIGIREYVMKPFVIDDMARIIRKVLDE